MTKSDVKKWQEKIENFSGITCAHLASLPKNATIDEMLEAKAMDRQWFKGFINDLDTYL